MNRNRVHNLKYGTTDIPYIVVRSRARVRTITIQVPPSGTVRVLAPMTASSDRIRCLLEQKANWIILKQAEHKHNHAPPREYVTGESIQYLGGNYRLRLMQKGGLRSPRVRLTGRFLEVTTSQSRPSKTVVRNAIKKWYGCRAREKLSERIALFAPRLALEHTPGIRLGNQASRWGSCSSAGTLSFNLRVMMAPLSIIDYVVAHELCHLKHHNHSEAFWACLRAILPDYEIRRQKLAREGWQYRL